MKIYYLFICTLIMTFGLTGCSRATNVPCDKQTDDLDKAYDAVINERSSDPQRVSYQFNDLRKKAEAAVKNCPNSIKLYGILSSSYMSLGRNSDALIVSEKALSVNSESAEANGLMGNALSVLNRHSEALPYLEKAVKLEPANVPFQLNLCSTYDMAKQYDKAISACGEIIKKEDKKFLGEALYIRARAYQAMGRKQEATKDFNRAKSLGVDLGEFYTTEHLNENQKTTK